MSMNVATPRDLIVAGLVSVVGQGVAVVAPHVGPAIDTAKAIVARSIDATRDGSERATDPGIDWAKRCVAAYRKSVEVAPELKGLPKECVTPVGANRELTGAPDGESEVRAGAAAEPPMPAQSMWEGQLGHSSSPGGSGGDTPRRNEQGKSASGLNDLQVAIAPSELDKMRGGFEMDGGFKFSFGIERAVYINGQLVTTQTLNSSDLRAGAAGPTAINLASNPALTVIQNGAGNTFIPGGPAATSGTVIQNALNGQTIQTQTVINASVNSMQALRSLNIQSAVRDGVIGSLRR